MRKMKSAIVHTQLAWVFRSKLFSEKGSAYVRNLSFVAVHLCKHFSLRQHWETQYCHARRLLFAFRYCETI